MTLINRSKPTAREALPMDIPQIVDLVRSVHDEVETSIAFDEKHAWKHMTDIVFSGVSFVAEIDDEIVGVIMAVHIDVAFAQTNHLETAHWYTRPDARSTGAGAVLLEAMENYADEKDIIVIFHQADYHSALNGKRNNSRAVERVYRSRGYEGPLDLATVGHEGRRVGVSYRYPPHSAKRSQSDHM